MFRPLCAALCPALISSALIAPSAMAEGNPGPACDKRSQVIKHLANKYEEAPVALGIANDGRLVEILSTQDGASWTLLLTDADGTSCLLASGRGWEEIPESTLKGAI